MKIENPLMRGFYAGLLAGMIGGIFLTTSHFMTTILGFSTFFTATAIPLTFDLLISHLGYSVGLSGMFGGIFGTIYSKLYNGVPRKGVMKGIVFGSIVLLFTNINIASRGFVIWLYTLLEVHERLFSSWPIVGFLIWIPYGVVLGVLYERWK